MSPWYALAGYIVLVVGLLACQWAASGWVARRAVRQIEAARLERATVAQYAAALWKIADYLESAVNGGRVDTENLRDAYDTAHMPEKHAEIMAASKYYERLGMPNDRA